MRFVVSASVMNKVRCSPDPPTAAAFLAVVLAPFDVCPCDNAPFVKKKKKKKEENKNIKKKSKTKRLDWQTVKQAQRRF